MSAIQKVLYRGHFQFIILIIYEKSPTIKCYGMHGIIRM